MEEMEPEMREVWGWGRKEGVRDWTKRGREKRDVGRNWEWGGSCIKEVNEKDGGRKWKTRINEQTGIRMNGKNTWRDRRREGDS